VTFLVIDVGTSSVRAVAFTPDAEAVDEEKQETLPSTPAPGLVELDAARLAEVATDLALAVAERSGPIAAVGLTNQRGTTVVWDRATGEPVGPALGWQDLRTLGDCLTRQGEGLRLAPNQSATKITWLLDTYDPGRQRDLLFGTVDTWIAWHLSRGEAHVTDASNAAVTGLLKLDGSDWDETILAKLGIPATMLPNLVDSTGELGTAHAIPGGPPIRGMAGDQQASLVGQGCVRPGSAKITFGTGGMLDLVVDGPRPFELKGPGGTFPIVAWRQAGRITWGLEAIILSAGTNVEWLRDDLGIIETVEASDAVARRCTTTDGVVFVPALLGLGTPQWDYGARGTLLGVTRGTGRPEIVRAVLEGVAQRGADLLAAAEADAAITVPTVRIDGGMSRNPTFVQALADATQRPIEVSPVFEATARGAALLAGLASGTWGSWDDVAATWAPAATVEPGPPTDRERWARAVERAGAWYPELSGLDF
jgi:glycerol kinase